MAVSSNRIRELREEIGMTQIRLSTELEVSQETVSAYETGRHYPSFASLLRMAGIFHTSIDYLMGLSDQRRPAAEKGRPELSGDERQLLELFDSLGAMEQARAIAYLQGLHDASARPRP